MSRVLIVGGVAGGASAATRLRRLDESAEIVVFERGPHVSFANCGLPYHIGGVIRDRDALMVTNPEKLRAEFNLDVRTLHEVIAIDRSAKQVTVRKVDTGKEYVESYDQLILSPGALPIVPPIAGVDLPGVFTLRNMTDMDSIIAHLESVNARAAIVVGAGFIGLEMAENLSRRGLDVTVVEMLDQVLCSLDFEMVAPLHRHLRRKGVQLALSDGLQTLTQTEEGRLLATLKSGSSIAADMVILSVGVKPNNILAKAAGLELGPKGHIVVDQSMRTADESIYAVGDAVQVINPITGGPTAVPLAGPANRQARIAADNIAGRSAHYRGTQGTSVVKVFDLAVAATGMNSRQLAEQGIAFVSTITHSPDHASYYPGASDMTTKLLYAPEDGRLLGAQVLGIDGVDRTVDVLATALAAGMSVFDLEHLELAYAPPYGSAKDAVNIAGFVAANRLRGDTDMVQWDDIGHLDPTEDGLLDVRTQLEHDLGHIEGSVHIPVEQLRQRVGELSKDKRWVVYCKIGRRAYIAERILRQHGFSVANLSGGWNAYEPVVSEQRGLDHSTVHRRVDECVTTPVAASPHTAGGNGHEPTLEVDACGLQCPGPILAVYREMQKMEPTQVLKVTATDPGFARDIGAWTERTGNQLLELNQEGATLTALIEKRDLPTTSIAAETKTDSRAKTIVVFSGDLDKALASFIIANGAAAMGKQVTMFFTFWGLNVLRRSSAVRVKKNLVERMFGWMMPRGAKKLKLSQMHMVGAGTAMIKAIMRAKNVDSLEALILSAQENGVRLVACQMSMDLMGIKPEELIDGVEIGGVATYVAASDEANANLFI